MKYYGSSKEGAIGKVEIVDRPEHLQIYIEVNQPSAMKPAEEKLKTLGFSTLSKATVKGHPVIVAIGPRVEYELIKSLSTIDAPLTPKTTTPSFDAWKVRSMFGFSGQLLQLASSVLKNKVDAPLLLFASSNLAANTINLVYKGQKRDDPHQLNLIKTEINNLLTPKLTEHKHLPDIHDDRSLLREHIRDNAPHPINHFMQRYSVNVGELGLRYIGAFGMAFPASGWKQAWRERRMPATNIDAPLRTFTGLTSMFGKTVATASKVPDPYNPQGHSTLDTIREKYTFLAGGLIEAGAFSALSYDAWVNSNPAMKVNGLENPRSLKIGGKLRRDWLSAVGGSLFVIGYIARSWASYGERKVDMPEVYAHASDAIAVLPRDQIPQALGDVSAYLANHFKGKHAPSFGEIYNKISDDLCREHHVTLMRPVDSSSPVTQENPEIREPSHTIDTKEAQHSPMMAANPKQLAL